jgi:nucleotidyltransferase/DNA polymerase involved in DNA repair
MKTGPHPALPLAADRQTATVTPVRSLLLDADPADAARATLLRRLACDLLRDLRDDGVTVGYMARMYGVEQGMMEEMMNALGLGPH